MAVTTPKYLPGWKHTVEIDGVTYQSMGLTATPTTEDNDVTTNDDAGWSADESGTKTVELSFSMPVKAANLTTPPVVQGLIYPMTFSANSVVLYDGDFRVTGAKLNAPTKGPMTLDVTVKNYGDVTPTP